ncbi:hypothetical protein Sgleb_46770 [Streptomyces glebosus]|uniref:Uncharacterized protein n=1 Tax=Streptomyces glebosus TaxID=249580 RepID=A0A640T0E9_9ACTN|nr:hypothetical protein Sgleb_46770 [Streptomyces glebosus]GHG75765.1 hypothetical protein GCM10010513_50610 [Streptomyces glebosus]
MAGNSARLPGLRTNNSWTYRSTARSRPDSPAHSCGIPLPLDLANLCDPRDPHDSPAPTPAAPASSNSRFPQALCPHKAASLPSRAAIPLTGNHSK